MNCSRRAFTLVELLVVIAIASVLMSLLLAAVQKARSAAAKIACANNLRQIGLALHQYHHQRECIPSGIKGEGPKRSGREFFVTWLAMLLPYIEQDALYQRMRHDYEVHPMIPIEPPTIGGEPYESAVHTGIHQVIPVYTCPADGRACSGGDTLLYGVAGLTSYLGVEGINHFQNDGVLFVGSRIRFKDIVDGASQTLVVGERPPYPWFQLGLWYTGMHGMGPTGSGAVVLGVREVWTGGPQFGYPCPHGPYHFVSGRIANGCDSLHFWSLHAGGGHFLFGDGSVRFLTYDADPVLPALATRAGGELVDVP